MRDQWLAQPDNSQQESALCPNARNFLQANFVLLFTQKSLLGLTKRGNVEDLRKQCCWSHSVDFRPDEHRSLKCQQPRCKLFRVACIHWSSTRAVSLSYLALSVVCNILLKHNMKLTNELEHLSKSHSVTKCMACRNIYLRYTSGQDLCLGYMFFEHKNSNLGYLGFIRVNHHAFLLSCFLLSSCTQRKKNHFNQIQKTKIMLYLSKWILS